MTHLVHAAVYRAAEGDGHRARSGDGVRHRPVLVELVPTLVWAVAPGGILVLAGLQGDPEASVRKTLATEPLTVVPRTQREEWVTLVWRQSV
jgi:hypothetical protein